MIERRLKYTLQENTQHNKVLLVVGPRQVGKTTLIKSILDNGPNYLELNGDKFEDRALFEELKVPRLIELIGENQVIFIDEAQRIPNIGINLKLITDGREFEGVRVYVSGSSTYDLLNRTDETLAGRKLEYRLYPISWEEYTSYVGVKESMDNLESRILYGMYPDIINNIAQPKERLYELVNSFLYKDLLSVNGVRDINMFDKMLKILAQNIGNKLNINKISNETGITRSNVKKYINILEQSFVIFRLENYKSGQPKLYFWDTGLRNAIVQNFRPLRDRDDKGALFENFVISEKLKQIDYSRTFPRYYYWQVRSGAPEVDFILEEDGKKKAYEIKWSENTSHARSYNAFKNEFGVGVTKIHPENFLQDFLAK